MLGARRIIPPAAAVIAASTLVTGFTQGSVDAVKCGLLPALLCLATSTSSPRETTTSAISPALHSVVALWSRSSSTSSFPAARPQLRAGPDSTGCQLCGIAYAVVGASCAVPCRGSVPYGERPWHAYLVDVRARAWQLARAPLLVLDAGRATRACLPTCAGPPDSELAGLAAGAGRSHGSVRKPIRLPQVPTLGLAGHAGGRSFLREFSVQPGDAVDRSALLVSLAPAGPGRRWHMDALTARWLGPRARRPGPACRRSRVVERS